MQLREKQNQAIEQYRSFNKHDITKLHKELLIFEIKPYDNPCWPQLIINESCTKHNPRMTNQYTKTSTKKGVPTPG